MKGLIFLVLAAIILVCSAQPNQVATNDQLANDLRTLNYALTLEHLEATFYREALDRFNETDFTNAGFPASVRSYISLIAFHEASHVDLLTSVIQANGGQAVRPCVYNFTEAFASIKNFITTAQVLEQTGTSAYDGAANTIDNAIYLEVAATIVTVEARHTAYLSELNNMSPFPESFEPTLTPAQVVAAAASFFISCPDNLTLPTFAYTYVPLSSNFTYLNRSGQPETQEQINNDNDVLNYALTLELFGAYFYGNAANFTQQDFTDAGFEDAYIPFQMIIQHEKAHVAFLQQTLADRGAVVAQSCSYNVGDALDSVGNALNFARFLENLEVTAYDGAINRLGDYQLIQGASTIATVEARHGQYLNARLLNIPVNNASLDTANHPEVILNITAPFFGADCVQPRIPVYAYTLQAFGTAQESGASSSSSASASSSSSASASASASISVSNTAAAVVPSASTLPSYCPSQSAEPSYCPSVSASPVAVCVPSPSPVSNCDCCDQLKAGNEEIYSQLQTMESKIASALRKVAALDDIEEELSGLSGVSNKLNKILSTVQELNGGSGMTSNQAKRSVEEKVVYVRSVEESSAGRSGNWVNGLF